MDNGSLPLQAFAGLPYSEQNWAGEPTAMPPRDAQAEQARAAWLGWMEASTYSTHPDDCEGMDEAFTAGMEAQRALDAAHSTGLVDVHFVGNGPHPLQLLCLTEDDSDTECGHEITEVEPGAAWHEVEAKIAAHAVEHRPVKTIASL